MAFESHLELFIGKDHQFVQRDDATGYVGLFNEARTAIVDQTGWGESFMVKRRRTDADAAALITKTTGNGGIQITGGYNSAPATNTQQSTVTVLDSDTSSLNPGVFYWEWSRTDDGFETVLGFGTITLKRSVHR